MNNFLRCCCGFIFSFLLFPSVFGCPEQEAVEGIYICTKDVDRAGSLVSEKMINDYPGDEFLPLDGVVESGKKHQIGRHCFMLHAKYKGIVVEPDGTKRLNLVRLDSYAFGKANEKTATYEEVLIGLPKNMAMSCTVLRDENDLSEEEINQEVIVIKEEVCNDGVCNNDYELKQVAVSEVMKKQWASIKRKMDLEKLKPYNLRKQNCCTVAYKGAATLFGHDENQVKEKVDPQTFNIYGLGVVWSNPVLASSWLLTGSSRNFKTEPADTSTGIQNTIDEMFEGGDSQDIKTEDQRGKDEL
jgi:hypothetical protein